MLPNARPHASRWFFLLLSLFLGAHAFLRLLLYHSLEYDEAEQLLFAQSLNLGYAGQPPLYTWLVWALSQVVGANVLALALVKFSLLASLFVLLYHIGLRLLGDPRTAALAAFSPLLVPHIGWEFIRMMTHTSLLCVLVLATVAVLIRLRDHARTRHFVALGFCLGLGALSKYNFVVFAAGLLAATFSLPEFRRRLLDRRLLLTGFIALGFVVPHAVWLVEHHREASTSVLKYSPATNSLAWGTADLVRGMAYGLGPILLAGLAIFPPLWMPRDEGREASEDERLLPRFFLLSVALLGLALFVGVRAFRVHWFGPLILLAPIWLLGRLRAPVRPLWRHRVYIGLLGVAGVGVLVGRSAALWFDYRDGQYKSRDFLFRQLAEQVRADGTEPRAIVCPDRIAAGYQRLHFPAASVHCPPLTPAPRREQMPLLLVWDATQSHEMPPHIATERGAGHIQHIDAQPCVFTSSTRRLGYLLLQPR